MPCSCPLHILLMFNILCKHYISAHAYAINALYIALHVFNIF